MNQNADMPTSTSSPPLSRSRTNESPGDGFDRHNDGQNDEPDLAAAARRQLEEAERAEQQARKEQQSAESEERIAQEALFAATQAYEAARIQQAEADLAVEEAERVLLEAKESQLRAVHWVIDTLEKKNEAAKREQGASRRCREAVKDGALKRMYVEEARRLARGERNDPTESHARQPRERTRSGTNNQGEPEWRAQARKLRESVRRSASPPPGEPLGRRGHWGFQFGDTDTAWRNKEQGGVDEMTGSRASRPEVVDEVDQEAEKVEQDSKEAAEAEEWMRQERIREEEEARMQEEIDRRNALEESIRKMKAMREQEEMERLEKERQARLKKELEKQRREEAERSAREARERRAREEVERTERERRERLEEEARRQTQYKEAAARERSRCQTRDRTQWNIRDNTASRQVWTARQSLSRFQVVCTEFDSIKFCDSQPLTFASVPWPLLRYPPLLTFEDIEWKTVEDFFSAAKLITSESEYKSIVEKTHRRFHPDKWRSRGILNSVLDEELRKRLEYSGNVVAQALTPIWLASKS